jgi:hypothetical protein
MRRPLHSLGEEVSKVKKRTGVTGERNTMAGSGSGRSKQATKKSTTITKKAKVAERSTSKKGGLVRRVGRTATAGKKGGAKAAAGRKPTSARSKGAKSAKASKEKEKKRASLVRGRHAAVAAPVVRVAIKPLDPLRKCGPNTTVQFLYRVDETVDGRSTAHLVFFDRHGWYCEHGRTCPAVGHAKKYNGQIARVS